VDDSFAVQVGGGRKDLSDDLSANLLIEANISDQLIKQNATCEQLHDELHFGFILEDFDDSANVGVVQLGEHLDFVQNFQTAVLLHVRLVDDLDCPRDFGADVRAFPGHRLSSNSQHFSHAVEVFEFVVVV
jgi:hypothetical protein